MNAFDVRIYAIRRRPDRRRKFEVCWHAAGRAWSRSFTTPALADAFRAELIRAARTAADFNLATGLPVSWAAAAPVPVTWHEHAAGYTVMKWPRVAAHSRAGIADALATITSALVTGTARRPASGVLRAPLYGWAVNPGRADCDPPAETENALAWARRHSLPLASLADPRVTRRALDALTFRLDGRRAAAATITRKRAVFCNALGYATELGLLGANPLTQITWQPPAVRRGADDHGRRPLTCPDLAHNWPTDTGNGPRNRSRVRIRPGPQTGPDLQLCVAGVGFEPT